MKKWEYLIADVRSEIDPCTHHRFQDGDTESESLNAFGEEGWELVCFEEGKCIFKREKVPGG